MTQMKDIGCTCLQPKDRFVEAHMKVQPTLVKLIFTVYRPLQGTLFVWAPDWALGVRPYGSYERYWMYLPAAQGPFCRSPYEGPADIHQVGPIFRSHT